MKQVFVLAGFVNAPLFRYFVCSFRLLHSRSRREITA